MVIFLFCVLCFLRIVIKLLIIVKGVFNLWEVFDINCFCLFEFFLSLLIIWLNVVVILYILFFVLVFMLIFFKVLFCLIFFIVEIMDIIGFIIIVDNYLLVRKEIRIEIVVMVFIMDKIMFLWFFSSDNCLFIFNVFIIF